MKLLHPHHVIFLLRRVINHSQIKQEVHFRIDSKQFVSMSDTCWWDWLVNCLRFAGGNMAVLLCFIRAANWALQAEASSAKVAHLFFFFSFCSFVWWHLDQVGGGQSVEEQLSGKHSDLPLFATGNYTVVWRLSWVTTGWRGDCNELSRSRCRVVSGALMGATDASLQLRSQQERWGALCRSAYTKEHCRVTQCT